jgi:hypothetical protein
LPRRLENVRFGPARRDERRQQCARRQVGAREVVANEEMSILQGDVEPRERGAQALFRLARLSYRRNG